MFIGAHTPESVGDYIAGPSHVLPTGGSARFASPLGVGDFIKRTSIIEYDAAALSAQADDIERLATVEDLDGHGRAVTIRTPGDDGMNLAATLRGTTYRFRDLKQVLAKANEEKSGDRLAGLAADSVLGAGRGQARAGRGDAGRAATRTRSCRPSRTRSRA